MQTPLTTTSAQARQAKNDTEQGMGKTAGDGAEKKARTPKITAPAMQSSRPSGATNRQSRSIPSGQPNQIVETPHSNENSRAVLSRLRDERPTLEKSAIEYADDYLNQPGRKQWLAPSVNERLNASELVMVDFTRSEPMTPSASPGRLTPLDYDPRLLTTMPLTQLFTTDDYATRLVETDTSNYGIYKETDLQKPLFVTASNSRYTSDVQDKGQQVDPNVATTVLSMGRLDTALKGTSNDPRAGSPNGLRPYYMNQLNAFFDDNLDQYAQARRQQMIEHIDQAALRREAIASGSIGEQSDEPRFNADDENMVRSAMDGSVPGGVKVYPLRIGQHDSINAQRFTDHTDRTVLHMPGETSPLRAFDNLQKAQTWIRQEIGQGDRARIRQFANEYFSKDDAKGRSGTEKSVAHELRVMNRFDLSGMDTAKALHGDPFKAQAAVMKQKAIDDATTDMELQGTPEVKQEIPAEAAKEVHPLEPLKFPQDGSSSDQFSYLMRCYPTLQSAASTYARKYMKDAYNLDVDPDKTVLAEFSGGGKQGRYREKKLSTADVKTLTQVFIDNFNDADELSEFNPGTGKYGIYRVENNDQIVRTGTVKDPKASNSRATPTLINARMFFSDMTNTTGGPSPTGTRNLNQPNRFFEEITKQRADYYATHQSEFATALKTYALEQASTARGSALNEPDYALVRDAFNNTPGQNSTVQPLQINQVASTSALLISGQNGRTIAYLPGEKTPFIARNNMREITSWINEKRQDAPGRTEFDQVHFPIRKASELARVEKAIDSGFGAAFTQASHKYDAVSGGTAIAGDPFKASVANMIKDEQDDMGQLVKSNDALRSGQRLEKLGLVLPFQNTLDGILGQGKRKEDGLNDIDTDLGMLPLEFVGAGKVFKNGAKITKKAVGMAARATTNIARDTGNTIFKHLPTMNMPTRVNGQIGYPMSPPGAPTLPGRPQGTVLPPASSANGMPNRPADPLTVRQGQVGTDQGGSQINAGFEHSPDDTIPAKPRTKGQAPMPPVMAPVPKPRTKLPQQSQPSENIELDNMNNGPGRGNPLSTNKRFSSSSTSQLTRPSSDLTPPGTPTSSWPSPYVALDPVPSQEEVMRANQLLISHGVGKTPAPRWLVKRDWMKDTDLAGDQLVLPGGATTFNELIASQQKTYADLLNRQTVRLAEAYQKNMPPTEISALIATQTQMAKEAKHTITSQWAQIDPAKPMTSFSPQDLSSLERGVIGFRRRGLEGVERLKASKAKKEAELEVFLSQNMKNNDAVLARRKALQDELNQELKIEGDSFERFIKRRDSKIKQATVTVSSFALTGGAGTWIYLQATKK